MCDAVGPEPAVVEAADSSAPEVLRATAENLARAWAWIDRAHACIAALRASR